MRPVSYQLPPGNANRLREDSELDLDPDVSPEIRSWIDCDMIFHGEVHNDRLRVVLLRVPTVVAAGGYVYLNPSLSGRPGVRVRAMGYDPICALVADKDVARAVRAALFAKGSGIYNVAGGEVVAWCQGRMEFGPRALGNRSILANPSTPGVSDKVNGQVKFREKWRPFCPSVIEEKATEVLGTDHPAPYMTISFRVTDEWKDRIKEAVHVDGTIRPQIVSADANPTYHRLISKFHEKSGVPVVLNTSLNRRGEPMVCAPKDAVAMFYGCGLEHLFINDHYITK